MKAIVAVLAALVALGALFYFYTAPTTAPAEMTEAEIAQIEAEVLEWAEAFMDGWEAGTPDARCEANLALVHPDHVTYLTGGAPQRKADWFDYCMGVHENWASFTGDWTETSVRVISPDAAVFLGRYDSTGENVNGRVIRYPAGAQLILVERTADGWGFTLHENSNGPTEVVEEG
jgi:hypothetical protein